MDELRLGKITNIELAEWFGTTEKQISHKKKQFLDKLEDYCVFKPIRGGIEIKIIIKPFYVKNKNYQIAKDQFNNYWSETGLDTCTHVADQICADYAEELTVKPDTTRKHVSQVRNEFYGSPLTEEGGSQGHCKYMWCKKDVNGCPQFLTEEEENIKKDLLIKWFGSADEKTALVQGMVENGEISEEKAWTLYSSMMKLPAAYSGFLSEYKQITGIILIRGTLINKELQFVDEDN